MQLKTINKVCSTKLTEWLSSIDDKNLAKDVREALLLSGGSICSMFQGEPVNDYDVYIQDRAVLLRLVKYYTNGMDVIEIMDGQRKKEITEEYIDDYNDKHRKKLSEKDLGYIKNAYATSLRNLKDDQIKLFFYTRDGGLKVERIDAEHTEMGLKAANEKLEKLKYDFQHVAIGTEKFQYIRDQIAETNSNISILMQGIKQDKAKYQPAFFSPNAISLTDNIQIVIRFHGTPEDIHKTFDFIHPTNYFTFKTGVVANLEAMLSIQCKQLKYQGSFYPVTSIIRARKFIKRGWNIGAGELLKIMFQISQLNLSDPDILEEQLIGVDIAYFEALIGALREMLMRNPDTKIEPAYFNEIVDRIFAEAEGDFSDQNEAQ